MKEIEKRTENNQKQINLAPTNTELVLGFKTDLPEDEIKMLLEKSLKKSKDIKASEIITKMLENIKLENVNEENDLKLYLKNDGKNKFYNVVQNDKLTQTIAAYYYCKKPNQTILSDK